MWLKETKRLQYFFIFNDYIQLYIIVLVMNHKLYYLSIIAIIITIITFSSFESSSNQR